MKHTLKSYRNAFLQCEIKGRTIASILSGWAHSRDLEIWKYILAAATVACILHAIYLYKHEHESKVENGSYVELVEKSVDILIFVCDLLVLGLIRGKKDYFSVIPGSTCKENQATNATKVPKAVVAGQLELSNQQCETSLPAPYISTASDDDLLTDKDRRAVGVWYRFYAPGPRSSSYKNVNNLIIKMKEDYPGCYEYIEDYSSSTNVVTMILPVTAIAFESAHKGIIEPTGFLPDDLLSQNSAHKADMNVNPGIVILGVASENTSVTYAGIEREALISRVVLQAVEKHLFEILQNEESYRHKPEIRVLVFGKNDLAKDLKAKKIHFDISKAVNGEPILFYKYKNPFYEPTPMICSQAMNEIMTVANNKAHEVKKLVDHHADKFIRIGKDWLNPEIRGKKAREVKAAILFNANEIEASEAYQGISKAAKKARKKAQKIGRDIKDGVYKILDEE